MAIRPEDYTVGWVCAISVEYVIACQLLDEEYERSEAPSVDDENLYTFGRFHEHHTVITCLVKGRYGTTSAAITAQRMKTSFPSIRINLMVGIAGGVPSLKDHDIRLGDVVVSVPKGKYPGVIQYDFGKSIQHEGFQEMGHLSAPSDILLAAIQQLESHHKRKGSRIIEIIDKALSKNERLRMTYGPPPKHQDRLYYDSYVHEGDECDCQVIHQQNDIDASIDARLVHRELRVARDPVLHYGLIASANRLMKDAEMRDKLATRYGILCFDMEAAGLMNNFQCVIIRGISDYADTHKNDMWQGYAAATAAAYGKELIEMIPGTVRASDQPHNGQTHSSALPSQQSLQVSANTREFDVPFSLQGVPIAKKFIGREEELQMLKESLLPEVDKRRKLFVLRGMGGMGKTQLVVEFMRTHSTKFSAILWLDASSKDNLLKGLASLVGKIRSKSTQGTHATNEADYKATAQEALYWLSKPENNRWLLIYDNLDSGWNHSSPDSVAHDIQQYLPTADHGSIIITTRLVTLEQLGESYELKSVDDITTHGILRSWYKRSYNYTEGERLSECLGGLPLAIAQAGAYLQQSAQSVQRYLLLYERKCTELASLKQAWNTPLLEYSDRCVWTTWTMSFEAVREQNEHAANMLVLWSLLDRRDLWYGLFESAIDNTFESDGKQIFMQTLEKWLGKAAFEETTFDNTMRLLRSYSLIEGFEYADGYTMHPLVHRWTQLFYEQQYREIGTLAIALVGLAVPFSTNPNWSQLQLRILPHVQKCCSKAVSESKLFEEYITDCMQSQVSRCVLKSVRKLGDHFRYHSKFNRAEQMYGLALRIAEAFLPSNDEMTMDIAYSSGNVSMSLGNFSNAQIMFTRALNGRHILYGELHISTLRAIRSMGCVLFKMNKLEEAEVMFRRALNGLVIVVGDHHITTLMTCDDIGMLYIKQSKFVEAEEMLLRALKGFEAKLGAEHLTPLETTHNLGVLYTEKGSFKEAEFMFKKALLGYQTIYGTLTAESHIATIHLMRSFGLLYAIQDRRSESNGMFKKALLGYKCLQGSMSPECREMEELIAKSEASELSTRDMTT